VLMLGKDEKPLYLVAVNGNCADIFIIVKLKDINLPCFDIFDYAFIGMVLKKIIDRTRGIVFWVDLSNSFLRDPYPWWRYRWT
jgi:hypothetical protein